ncbi:MAG: hypothetical protein JW841_06685 [Deltaproteobacteria bacterium]|nr:hypothetical protein [Deltaproteobacteria bacterium]
MRSKKFTILSKYAFLSFITLIFSFVMSSCGVETVVHGVNEREANRIIETLALRDINADKLTNTSGRQVVYDITVAASRRIDAIKVLNENELPRRVSKGYIDVFATTGLIPTSSEEKAKKLAALEGEIERQLKLIEGVLDVEVQVVSPDESALRTTKEQEPATTASVTIKYLARPDGSQPISEGEVQKIVAAGVEKLMPEQVVVVMRPVATSVPKKNQRASTSITSRINPKVMTGIVIGAGALIALLIIIVIFSQWQVRSTRNRLNRLQSEIAKARKRSVEALQAMGESPPPG